MPRLSFLSPMIGEIIQNFCGIVKVITKVFMYGIAKTDHNWNKRCDCFEVFY